jgi:hypothetical protein
LRGDYALPQLEESRSTVAQRIIMEWQHISPEVNVKGSKKCCISKTVDGLIMVCCGMAVKKMGMLGASVRKTGTDW